ncbi:hypothetical protein EDD36DRAFT_495416 [Exophiala viscosa]|uniref:Uncharacterized protein n=1 Tax=Exophiala viscosa TaxID=2486360 RepID=A0AAN6IDX5_9EURO|nr:hypothetical protein EDD36DRAFT_495416 [Exophiala viscosa]
MRARSSTCSFSRVRSCTTTLYSSILERTYSVYPSAYHNIHFQLLFSVKMYHSTSLTLLAIGGTLQGLLHSTYATSLPVSETRFEYPLLVTAAEDCSTIWRGTYGYFHLYVTEEATIRNDTHHILNYTLSYPRALVREVCGLEARMGCAEEAVKLGAKQFSVEEGPINHSTATAEWTCRIYTKDDPNPELFSTYDWDAKYVWAWTLKDHE